MQLEFKRREKVVGVFILVIGLLLLSTVVVIGRGKDWFKTYVPYYTEFSESYNLAEKAPVKMAKATIGKVKKVNLEGDRVKVEIGIIKEYTGQIRSGSLATVESPTIIGEEYLSISPGPQDDPLLPPGSRIQSKPKKSLQLMLQEAMEKFEIEKTAKKVVTAIQDTTEIIAVLKQPDGPLFTALARTNKSLDHLEAILAGLEDGEGTLGGFIKSDELLIRLYANLDQLKAILENVTAVTARAPQTLDEVEQNLAAVKKVLENVDLALISTREILKNVQDSSQDIPQVTTSVKRGIGELRDNLKNIDSVVESIKQNPLIRGNLPREPSGEEADALLRP